MRVSETARDAEAGMVKAAIIGMDDEDERQDRHRPITMKRLRRYSRSSLRKIAPVHACC